MNKLIDLHNHVLPIDDGAQNDQDSIKMLYDAVESNISTVFVTPHMIPGGRYNPSILEITDSYNHLKQLIEENKIPITLKLGSEFQINSECLGSIDNKTYICYEDTNYLLVEFVRKNLHFGIISDALNELQNQNIRIIIAHPERYFDDIDEAFDMAYKWIKQGYFLQINRTSLLHNQNPIHRKIAFKLINANLIHLISSDAHNPEGQRRLQLNDSYTIIKRLMGKECADLLHSINPYHLTQNEELINMCNISRGYKNVLHYFIKYF